MTTASLPDMTSFLLATVPPLAVIALVPSVAFAIAADFAELPMVSVVVVSIAVAADSGFPSPSIALFLAVTVPPVIEISSAEIPQPIIPPPLPVTVSPVIAISPVAKMP